MKLSRILLTGLCVLPAFSHAGNWRINDSQSRLGFQYKAMGAPIDGEFQRYKADIEWDATRLANARIRLDVDTASIDAGLPDATAEALGTLFFDSLRYPLAQFVSSSITQQGKNRYLLTGTLNIKGIKRSVSLPVVLNPEGVGLRLKGAFQLSRLDYGIGTGQWTDTGTLSNEIQVAFSFNLLPLKSK